MTTKLERQIADLFCSMDCEQKNTNPHIIDQAWLLIQFSESVNNSRGFGNSLSTETIIQKLTESFQKYRNITPYPHLSCIGRVKETVNIIQQLAHELLTQDKT